MISVFGVEGGILLRGKYALLQVSTLTFRNEHTFPISKVRQKIIKTRLPRGRAYLYKNSFFPCRGILCSVTLPAGRTHFAFQRTNKLTKICLPRGRADFKKSLSSPAAEFYAALRCTNRSNPFPHFLQTKKQASKDACFWRRRRDFVSCEIRTRSGSALAVRRTAIHSRTVQIPSLQRKNRHQKMPAFGGEGGI